MLVNESKTHYAYPLVTWSSTLTGAAVALVTGFMLNLLGTSLGFATVAVTTAATHSLDKGADAATDAGIVGIVWMVFANLVALAFGAWVAARTSSNPDHHRGGLQGVAVWAVTSLIVLLIAGSTIAGTTGTMLNSAAMAGRPVAMHDNGNNQADPQAAADEAQARIDQNRPEDRAATVKAAGVTSAAIMGAFIAMLLGLFAAIFGARAGAKHPEWHDRPLYYQTYQKRDL